MDRDAVDMILEQWNKERPDVDVSSMGVLGRLNRASRLASLDVQKFMNQFGLEPWEFDVLATLRRSAAEAPLTPGRLASLTMIGSAAMTNRVDRLVSRGLVHRETNPENRRQLLISLTPEDSPWWTTWWSTTSKTNRRCSRACPRLSGCSWRTCCASSC